MNQPELPNCCWRGTAGTNGRCTGSMPLVHDELRRLAHHYMTGERSGHPLQTTALVNEAYLRLVDSSRVQWQNRAHFFAVSAQLMRRVLVDVARTRKKRKRGGDVVQVSLDEALVVSGEPAIDVIALDDALKALAAFDERKSKVVELRYFGGLSVDETAEALGVSGRHRDARLERGEGLAAARTGRTRVTPQKWRAIERLYLAALERDAGERADFLRGACGADEELRREVESLLEYQPRADGFLESAEPAGTGEAQAEAASAAEPSDRPPDRPCVRFV